MATATGDLNWGLAILVITDLSAFAELFGYITHCESKEHIWPKRTEPVWMQNRRRKAGAPKLPTATIC
jgi:hypothetical protein